LVCDIHTEKNISSTTKQSLLIQATDLWINIVSGNGDGWEETLSNLQSSTNISSPQLPEDDDYGGLEDDISGASPANLDANGCPFDSASANSISACKKNVN